MMKDLIIASYTRYDFTTLRPWVLSLKDTGFAGDIVVLSMNGDADTDAALEEHGVKVVKIDNKLRHNIVVSRFFYMYHYLHNHADYRYVLTTDMRDIIFQRNPSDYMERALGKGDKQLIAAGESLQLKYYRWNNENFAKVYGTYLLRNVGENDTYNAGVIAGTWEYMKDLCMQLFYSCQHITEWGPDQAAYQMLLYHQPWKGLTHFVTPNDDWALNAAIIIGDLDREEAAPYVIHKGLPYMEDGIVKNAAGEAYTLVHMYDRVLDWTLHYIEKYHIPVTKERFPYSYELLTEQAQSHTRIV